MMPSITLLLLVIFFSLITTLIFIPFAKKFKLIDLPNDRKTHKINAKLIGGIILILNFFLLIFLLDLDIKLNSLLNFSILIGLIGAIDDKYNLKVSSKLVLFFFPIILIILDGYTLTNLGEYNLIGQINLGSFAIIFTILSSYVLINATNYIDGKDGVLISIFFFINLKLIFIIDNSDEILKQLLIYINIILVVLFSFNITNNKNLKIFLGDSGSLTIGFFLSFLLIYLANNKFAHPIILASSVTVIVFDFLSISIERLFKNNGKIFRPDNNHIHYLIYNKTGSNFKVLLIINSINILFFSINYYLFTVYNFLALVSFIIEFFLFFNLRKILLK